jgi:hypothetical protein
MYHLNLTKYSGCDFPTFLIFLRKQIYNVIKFQQTYMYKRYIQNSNKIRIQVNVKCDLFVDIGLKLDQS